MNAKREQGGEELSQDDRDPVCVERWPECEDAAYDPRCCRFPKSCSASVSGRAAP